MTTDPTPLQERIADAVRQALSEGEAFQCTRVWEAWQYGTMSDEDFTDASDGPLVGEVVAAVLPIVEAEVRAAKAEALTKRWVCQVARSGFHNGASCRPDDAHNDWGCDYYYEASIRATEYETGDPT